MGQEFMIGATGANSFKEAVRMTAEVYHALKAVIKKKYGQDACNVGDEGGFAPNIQDNKEGLQLLVQAIADAGYTGKIKIGMDVAASEFYQDGKYNLDFKNTNADPSMIISGDELIEVYKGFVSEFPVVTIEDPFDQDDWEAYTKLTELMSTTQIVGDDLLVTNVERIKTCIEKKAASGLLLKVNQIGTIWEAIQACKMSHDQGWGVMVSHRSGETGHHHRRPGRGSRHWPDQDRRPLPRRAHRQVQPAHAHRGGARRPVLLRRRELPLPSPKVSALCALRAAGVGSVLAGLSSGGSQVYSPLCTLVLVLE